MSGLPSSAHGRALFTDYVYCPAHVVDLAAALRELAISDATGVLYLAPDAISCYELGTRIRGTPGVPPRRPRTSRSRTKSGGASA